MADSDSDAASVDEQNTFDSQDDMWPVIEITAEDKRKGYKVRWAGEDPSTGKPWAQSWVAKTEVTDHLRRTWEASGKGQKKKKRKSSTKPRKSSIRAASTSTTTTRRHVTIQDEDDIAEETDYDQPPSTVTSRNRTLHRTKTPPARRKVASDSEADDIPIPPTTSPRKRKRVLSQSDNEMDTDELLPDPADPATFSQTIPSRPSKKSKIHATRDTETHALFIPSNSRSPSTSPPSPPIRQHTPIIEMVEDSLEQEEVAAPSSPRPPPRELTPPPPPPQPRETSVPAPAPAHVLSSPRPTSLTPLRNPSAHQPKLSKAALARLKLFDREIAEIERRAEEERQAAASLNLEAILPAREYEVPNQQTVEDSDGVVPETQPSQDSVLVQRRSSSPGSVMNGMNGRSPSKSSLAGGPLTTPAQRRPSPQSSVIRSMNGRSPSKTSRSPSKSSVAGGSGKKVGPLPQLTKASFMPFLSAEAPTHSQEESIEDFSSPIKPGPSQISMSDDEAGEYVQRRGQQLADEAKRREKGSPPKKRRLEVFLAPKRKTTAKKIPNGRRSLLREERAVRGELEEGEIEDPEKELPPVLELPPPVSSEDEGFLMHYDGGAQDPEESNEDTIENSGSVPERVEGPRRLEEEESTQDILNEIKEREQREKEQREREEKEKEKKEAEEREMAEQAERERLQEEERERLAQEELERQKAEERERQELEERERLAAETREQEEKEMQQREEERAKEAADQVDEDEGDYDPNDMDLGYPEDDAMLSPVHRLAPMQMADDPATLARHLLSSQELVVSLRKECDSLKARTTSSGGSKLLEVAHEDALRKIDELTKDRDFFKEQYQQQSTYVTEIRRDNMLLEERVKIAEKQASDGVALIRATLEKRVEFLEANARAWQTTASFVQQKDAMMNDEIRRKAGEHAGLEVTNQELRSQVAERDVRLRRVQRDLEKERARWRRREAGEDDDEDDDDEGRDGDVEDRVPLPHRSEVVRKESVGRMSNRNSQVPASQGPGQQPRERSPFRSAPGIYPCLWRGPDRKACGMVFDSRVDLEEHMFDATDHLKGDLENV